MDGEQQIIDGIIQKKTWDCPCQDSRNDYIGNIIMEFTVKNLIKGFK